jgi:hypothetical protein
LKSVSVVSEAEDNQRIKESIERAEYKDVYTYFEKLYVYTG